MGITMTTQEKMRNMKLKRDLLEAVTGPVVMAVADKLQNSIQCYRAGLITTSEMAEAIAQAAEVTEGI